MTSVQYEVVTSVGAVAGTFDDIDIATAFAIKRGEQVPGLTIERVTHRAPLRQPVWPPEAVPVQPVNRIRRVA